MNNTNATKQDKIDLANSIMACIGNQNRLKMMIGAKQFMLVENGLSFKFPRSNGINYIKITLNGKDLFDVEYGYITAKGYKVKETSNDLYNDMLKNDIEQTIKKYLSL
jgi:hypothetical protein